MEVGLPVQEGNFSLLQSFHQTASEPRVIGRLPVVKEPVRETDITLSAEDQD
jgi:hypothetical protein